MGPVPEWCKSLAREAIEKGDRLRAVELRGATLTEALLWHSLKRDRLQRAVELRWTALAEALFWHSLSPVAQFEAAHRRALVAFIRAPDEGEMD